MGITYTGARSSALTPGLPTALREWNEIVVKRLAAFAILASMAALGGCSRYQDVDLPGPGATVTYQPAILGTAQPLKSWRYIEKEPIGGAPAVPFVAFSDESLTISVSCPGPGQDKKRKLRVGAAQPDVYHATRTVAVRYRFDKNPEQAVRWKWYQDAAGQTGPAAVRFARDLAKGTVLRFRLQGGPRQTVSLKGSASPIRKVLEACGHGVS